jgi:hypothetical protein
MQELHAVMAKQVRLAKQAGRYASVAPHFCCLSMIPFESRFALFRIML